MENKEIDTSKRVFEVVVDGIPMPVGLDTTTQNPPKKDEVALGKEVWANGKKITGTLTAYDVEEEITGKDTSRLVIRTVGETTPDKWTKLNNINSMKIADFISNTQKGTNYNLTEEEYEEAHKELQVLMKKQMFGEKELAPDIPAPPLTPPETEGQVLGVGDIDLTGVINSDNLIVYPEGYDYTYDLGITQSTMQNGETYMIDVLDENGNTIDTHTCMVFTNPSDILGGEQTSLENGGFLLLTVDGGTLAGLLITFNCEFITSVDLATINGSRLVFLTDGHELPEELATAKTLRISPATTTYSLRPATPTSSWRYVFDKEKNRIIKIYENGG